MTPGGGYCEKKATHKLLFLIRFESSAKKSGTSVGKKAGGGLVLKSSCSDG